MILNIFSPRRFAALGRAATALFWLTVAAGSLLAADVETEDPRQADAEVITVELNDTETVSGSCRLSFVIRNGTPNSFAALQWDLVFFGTDGVIANRMAIELAPLPAGKTSVKLYDVPGLACDRVGRVLLNHVIRCEGTPDDHAPVDCLQQTRLSSRTGIELIK